MTEFPRIIRRDPDRTDGGQITLEFSNEGIHRFQGRNALQIPNEPPDRTTERAADHAPGGAADPALQGLNEEQRRAVMFGEGPLLIVAGAGTGKTSALTRRIAWLIAARRARPSEILALTFTDKAAAEMEERVDLLVPYGYTDITISTFHAFGDRVLRQHALELGLAPDVRVLSRAEQVLFLRERLFELPLQYYRPLGDPTRYVEALIALFSRAKDEDAGPEEYAAYAERLAAAAAAAPDDAELADAAQKQMELAQAYRIYQGLLGREGLLDFGDQITLPLRLFRERPTVLRAYQERFRYILVDEFQDTNYAQFQLVQLLAGPQRNVTVVGDDDQAIFKFRGASISNILGFTSAYPEAIQIVLTRNYRSPQSVLDAAYRLIRHNDPDRLEVRNHIDKRLTAVAAGPEVNHLHFDTLSSEADGVAAHIAERVGSGAYRYKDFAILVRSNNDADPFLRALNMRGVPHRFTGNRGLYNREEIRLVLAFLRALANPSDNLSLYYLGISPLYLISPTDVAKALAYANRRNRTLEYVFRRLDAFTDLAEEIGPETRAALARLLDDLDEMRRLMKDHATGRVLYTYLVSRTGYVRRLATSETPADEMAVRNLARLFDIVARYGEIAAYDRVPEFVKHLDDLITAGDDPAVAEADPDTDAVNMLTVHKAKGLEFPVVFLVSAVVNRFPTSNRGEPIPLPDPLVKDILPQGDFHLQEERRLFYVAMTRAMRELYLTSARDYGGVRARKVSRFVLEALDRPAPEGHDVFRAAPTETIQRHAPPAEGQQTLVGVIPPEAPLILSFRQVDDYNTCPLKFKYTHILRVPLLRDHRVVYGSAVHEAVREYNRRRARAQPVTAANLLTIFERAWINEGFVSREHEDQRMEEGRAVLRTFFDFQEGQERRPTFVEAPFSFQVGLTRVKGRWDRVDLRGAEAVVIDFKTSDVRTQKDADRRARESLQLAIYALAYREVYGRPPDRLELHFLGPQQVLVGETTPADDMLVEAAEAIEHASRGVRIQQFIATPDYYRACRYCAFNTICPYTATGDPVLPETPE